MSYRSYARRVARRRGVNPGVFERQIQQESGFNPNARSPAGATGIAQFMPATARSRGVNPNNPKQALRGAADLMAEYLRSYHGDYRKALAAYNAGPGNVGRWRSIPETRNYVSSILHGENPKSPAAGGASFDKQGVKITESNVLDKDAFEQAKRGYVLGTLLAKHHGTTGPLFKAGLVSTTAPDQQSFMHSVLKSKVTRDKQTAGGGTGNPKSVKGTAMFEGKRVAAWIVPELQYARKHGWKGTVTSGFRTRADQTRIYNSGVRPAARPGTSNHEGADFPRGAVDVSDAQTLARILRRKRSPLVFAGAKDPVHFSHPHGGSY